MIRICDREDEWRIYSIINEAAKAYKGVIPEDRYHEPYMPLEELRNEMEVMTFYGYEEEGEVVGVAGFQPVKDTTLVRHTYVLPQYQRKGIGKKLLTYIKSITITKNLLVGTWKAANWAIRFYEKNGFTKLQNKEYLLRKYWDIPERQITLSVVLGMTLIDVPINNKFKK